MENAGVRPNEKISSVDDVKSVRACIRTKWRKIFSVNPISSRCPGSRREMGTPFGSNMQCEVLICIFVSY